MKLVCPSLQRGVLFLCRCSQIALGFPHLARWAGPGAEVSAHQGLVARAGDTGQPHRPGLVCAAAACVLRGRAGGLCRPAELPDTATAQASNSFGRDANESGRGIKIV